MKEKIQKLLHDVLSADWSTRSQAVAELMTLEDPETAPQFYELLDKKSELLCSYFCQFLGKTLFVSAAPYLIEFLSDQRERIQQEAVWALDRFLQSEKIEERHKVAFLLRTLKTAEEKGRIYAASALGHHHKKEGVTHLIESLKDQSQKVRLASVDSLREIGERTAAPYLVPMLKDPDFQVRYAAVFALGELEYSDAWEDVRSLLEDPKVTVRQAATWASARLAGHKAIPFLIKRLEQDTYPLVRIEAAKRLGKIEHKQVVAPLLSVYTKDKDPDVRSAANYALDGLAAPLKINIYLKHLRDKDPALRTAVLSKIAEIKSKDVFHIIEKVYRKSLKDPQTQATCCECFGIIGDKRAIPLLEKAIQGNPIVSYSAVRSLTLLMDIDEIKLIESLLKDLSLGAISHQVILQVLLKKIEEGHIYLIPSLSDILLKTLMSKNINISYLSARILGASSDMSMIIPLLKASEQTKDPELKQKCYQSVNRILDGNFVILIKLLSQPFVDDTIRKKIFLSILNFKCKEKYKVPAIVGLINFYLLHKETYRMDILSMISHIADDDAQPLLKVLYQTHWPDKITKDILYILDGKIKESPIDNLLLNIAPLKQSINHLDIEIRTLSIRLLEKIGQVDAIDTLMPTYLREKEDKVKNYVRAAIRSIVQGGSAS